MVLLISCWCLYCFLWTYFTPFSSLSIVASEHANVCWGAYFREYRHSVSKLKYNDRKIGVFLSVLHFISCLYSLQKKTRVKLYNCPKYFGSQSGLIEITEIASVYSQFLLNNDEMLKRKFKKL